MYKEHPRSDIKKIDYYNVNFLENDFSSIVEIQDLEVHNSQQDIQPSSLPPWR